VKSEKIKELRERIYHLLMQIQTASYECEIKTKELLKLTEGEENDRRDNDKPRIP